MSWPTTSACSAVIASICRPDRRSLLSFQSPGWYCASRGAFRTSSFNSIHTLAARMQCFRAMSSDRLECLPLELRLRGKSTRQSHSTPILYVDITVRSGMAVEETLQAARQLDESRQTDGLDQAALDAAARQGFGKGAF
ncbi:MULTISPECIES: hypothetical protein [Pseudomonas]|uniref:recombination directionality factor n=1 Tax=Pseudomonas TaxID=286 RepID=UPI002E3775CC|nr:hypothetical protein [Pseudomonas aeruginosa]